MRQIRRSVKLLVPLLIVCCIQFVFHLELLAFGGKYILVISAIYLIYGITAILIQDKKHIFCVMISFSFLYSVVFQFCVHDVFVWQLHELGFGFGILYAVFQDKIEAGLKKNAISVALVSSALFVFAAVLYIHRYSDAHDITVLTTDMYMLRVLMEVMALFALLAFLSFFKLGNKISIYTGRHLSMYIFIFHGLMIEWATRIGLTGEKKVLSALGASIVVAVIVDGSVRLMEGKRHIDRT